MYQEQVILETSQGRLTAAEMTFKEHRTENQKVENKK
jgi:hypothetical protein